MQRATPISLTEAERRNLEQLKRGRRVAVRLAERAAIVLLADDGLTTLTLTAVMRGRATSCTRRSARPALQPKRRGRECVAAMDGHMRRRG